MLHIKVPAGEFFNERTQEFVTSKEQDLYMEHSLLSISKWEAKWKKSYLSSTDKTPEEVLDYIRCMTVRPVNVDPSVYQALTKENIETITNYIQDPMTATTINTIKRPGRKNEVITSEIVYYWMIAQNIPTEYEKWHINRLLTLIEVCAIKNDPNPKKMNRHEIARQNRALNAARRKRYGTRG